MLKKNSSLYGTGKRDNCCKLKLGNGLNLLGGTDDCYNLDDINLLHNTSIV